MVGDLHQVFVGPFVPRQPGEPPRSVVRNNRAGPKLVWEPNQVSEEDLQEFLDELATLHAPYLKEHGLTAEDPVHTPIPTSDEAEQVMLQRKEQLRRLRSTSLGTKVDDSLLLTGSFMSTASSLSLRRNLLLKECASQDHA